MSHAFREKLFYRRTSRHAGEPYSPIVASDGQTLAYLQTSAETETLMLQRDSAQPAVAVSTPGFLFSPCFAGDWLVWAQQSGDNWELRGARWGDPHPQAHTFVFGPTGRPIHLVAAAVADGAWLAWEERHGRDTQIRLCFLDATGIPRDVRTVSRPGINAYDPVLVVAHDGGVFCAFTTYADDNYRISVASFAADGSPLGVPLRVSDRCEACVWPSLWPAAGGGVWFSFTSYSVPNSTRPEHNQALSYVKHGRYLRQRQFFGCHGIVHVGLLRDGKLFAPLAGPSANDLQFFTAAGLVLGSEGAGHSQVLEDQSGGVHVLLRQHARPEPALVPERASPPLRVHPRFTPKHPRQMHPNLALTSLVGKTWSPPQTLVPRAHFDLALSLRCDGRALMIAFGEDARLTGWSCGGEWFDDVGEVGVGRAHITLDLHPPAAAPTLCPLAIAPFPAGRITNPHTVPAAAATWADRTFAVGQTHCHSNLSICRRELDRDPHFNYRFMQDAQRCRFGLLTDHDYNLWHTEMLLLRKLAEYYYFPGEFVALPGYEWTGSDPRGCSHDGGPFGHVNVLGFDRLATTDFHNPSDPTSPGSSLEKLWRASAGRPVLTPPHHVVDRAHPYNWEFWSDEFEPFIEIFQDDRGSGEQPDAPGLTNSTRSPHACWAVDALRRGCRFGFVAGGDHSGVALAGVWLKCLTRAALLAALRERVCYATTGIHAAIMFTCNCRPLGSEHAGTPAHFELTVGSVEPVARVEVLRNGEIVRTFNLDTSSTPTPRWSWSEFAAVAGDFWYCRIHWADGELGWTSPVWL